MRRDDQWIGGAVLIAIGGALLLGGQIAGDSGQFVLLIAARRGRDAGSAGGGPDSRP